MTALDWDITRPPSEHSGLRMAGFTAATQQTLDLTVVPHPALTVVLNLGGEMVVESTSSSGIVVGLAPRGLHGRGSSLRCLQVRLSPTLAHAIFPGSAALQSHHCDLTTYLGPDAGRLEQRLHAAQSWDERFTIVQSTLLARAEHGRRPDREITFAWERLVRAHGQLRIDALAAELGWSRKRLWSRFGAQIGLSPKRAAQLIRFDVAARRLASGTTPAQAAAECGYVDQSHLNRDTKTFTDLTPPALAQAPWLSVDDVAWPHRSATFIQARPRERSRSSSDER